MARQKSFTVHMPPPRVGKDANESVEFVQDSFSPIAFVAPWLYFLTNRMWLETFVYVALSAIVIAGFWLAGLPDPIRLLMSIALNLLIGLEAVTLKRWLLSRRGYREIGVVVAGSKDEAERRWFAEAGAQPAARAPVAATSMPTTGSAQPIIGFFPDAQTRPRGAP